VFLRPHPFHIFLCFFKGSLGYPDQPGTGYPMMGGFLLLVVGKGIMHPLVSLYYFIHHHLLLSQVLLSRLRMSALTSRRQSIESPHPPFLTPHPLPHNFASPTITSLTSLSASTANTTIFASRSPPNPVSTSRVTVPPGAVTASAT